MQISKDKQYTTKSGLKVRAVLCIDSPNPNYPVVVELETGVLQRYRMDGRFSIHNITDMDLFEIPSYQDFKIDEQVIVSDMPFGKGNEFKRHFAGVSENGRAKTWANGTTSWSSCNSNSTTWNFCRRPTEEELKGYKGD